MKSFIRVAVRIAVFSLTLFAHVGTANALTLCSGQPATLHWTSSGVTSCTPYWDITACSFAVTPNTPGSKTISLSSGSCNVQLACNGVSKIDNLTVDPTLGTWNGSSCVANACSNGAVNSSFPACNQCPDGYAYLNSACAACAGNPIPTGCSGAGGNASNPYGSLVCKNGASNPIACNSFAPTATLSANPSTIDSGQSTKLFWSSTNATSCVSAGGFSTSNATSNTVGVSTGVLAATTPYAITCTGPGGSVNANTTVTVLQPTASISANPTRVSSGSSSIISWSAFQVQSCVISGPGLSATGLTGSQSVTITSRSTYTITCQTNSIPVSSSVTVNIDTLFQEF